MLGPNNTPADVLKIRKEHGFSGIPITDTGKIGGRLLGLVTLRDIDFLDEQQLHCPVSTVSIYCHILRKRYLSWNLCDFMEIP